MDKIEARQAERQRKQFLIKDLISRAIKADRDVDFEKLVLTVRDSLSLSDRTAKDYIKLALFQLNTTKEKICKKSN